MLGVYENKACHLKVDTGFRKNDTLIQKDRAPI